MNYKRVLSENIGQVQIRETQTNSAETKLIPHKSQKLRSDVLSKIKSVSNQISEVRTGEV